jgi:hypothetical protein
MNRRARILALATLLAGLSCRMPVFADDAPAAPAAQASDAAAATPRDAATSTATTSPAAPTAGSAAAAGSLASGPLLEQRKHLLDQIHQANSHGIGTANYMLAFKAIEDQVNAGAPETQIRPRVESLTNSLADQLKRAQILKTQRPLPPVSSQQPETTAAVPGTAPVGATAGGAAAAGIGGLPSGMVDKLKSQFGNVDLDKLMSNDKARELLKKFGQ